MIPRFTGLTGFTRFTGFARFTRFPTFAGLGRGGGGRPPLYFSRFSLARLIPFSADLLPGSRPKARSYSNKAS